MRKATSKQGHCEEEEEEDLRNTALTTLFLFLSEL